MTINHTDILCLIYKAGNKHGNLSLRHIMCVLVNDMNTAGYIDIGNDTIILSITNGVAPPEKWENKKYGEGYADIKRHNMLKKLWISRNVITGDLSVPGGGTK